MSALKQHRHRGYTLAICAYFGPVAAPGYENPMAHGSICRVLRCKCGAIKRVNVNGRHSEHGPWEEHQ